MGKLHPGRMEQSDLPVGGADADVVGFALQDVTVQGQRPQPVARAQLGLSEIAEETQIAGSLPAEGLEPRGGQARLAGRVDGARSRRAVASPIVLRKLIFPCGESRVPRRPGSSIVVA